MYISLSLSKFSLSFFNPSSFSFIFFKQAHCLSFPLQHSLCFPRIVFCCYLVFPSLFLFSFVSSKGEHMWQNQAHKSSFRESLKALEADIQHANNLAASLPGDYNGDCVQMRLSYSPLAPLFLYLIEWMDYSCTDSLPSYLGLLHILIYKVYVDGIPSMSSSKERKASLREFYAVIYPSLRQLRGEFIELEDDDNRNQYREVLSGKRGENQRELSDKDLERDEECGICMENGAMMVLPNCGHSMCICCFHDWNARSESCPFCRGCLKRVSSTDLWVLTSNDDVIDPKTLAKENLRRFYRYIENLSSFVTPDTHVLLFDYML